MVVTTSYTTSSVVAAAPVTNAHNKTNSTGTNKSYWKSPGKVAGTFVAVGVVVVALILFIIWYFFINPQKKRRDFEEQYNEAVLSPRHHHGSGGTDSFTYSQGRSSSTSQGLVYADEKGIIEPALKVKRTSLDDESLDYVNTANSVPIMVDQRLDPKQMYSETQESNSKLSLADDVDYSRKVLRVINE